MRLPVLAAAVLALGAVPTSAVFADAPPGDYDDPAMHFSPPAGFERVSLKAQAEDDGSDAARPVAAYVYHAGKPDQRSIVISIANFAGSLADFDRSHESELRQAVSSTFVSKKQNVTLPNGMPAVFLKINQGDTLGSFVRRDEYLIVDGKRSIDVAYVGQQGDFDEAQAMDALKTLSVVLYPRNRP